MRKVLIALLAWCLSLCFLLPARAGYAENDSTFDHLYRDFLTLYSSTGHDEEFYKVARKMEEWYLKHDNLLSYYNILMNEALYDAEHNQPYRAIKTANAMLDDMKERGVERYDLVYTALGTVYDSRGNIRMARHYYQLAEEAMPEDDLSTQMGMYSRLAYLLMLSSPDEARVWNSRYWPQSETFPPYRQVYLFIECVIDFANDDKPHFEQAYSRYQAYRVEHPELDNYGVATVRILRMAFDRQWEAALDSLRHPMSDVNDLMRSSFRGKIYERMGDYRSALDEANYRSALVDSLNSDMLFNNINQISAEAGIAKMKNETMRSRERLFMIAILSALALIAMLGVWIYNHRRMSRHLRHKNEQLGVALAMAEESDKMKTEFVRSVSHEIRTPLNAITGFNEIINDPTMQLAEDERKDLVQRIKENVQAITDIVDEMLHMADQESQEFYAKTDEILCNQFFSSLLYAYRDRVSSSIELKYSSRLLNRFTIKSNKEGLRRIIDHLIQNAIKFTSKGHIVIDCDLLPDDDLLRLAVTDTGRGVSAEKRDKIFEQFYKEDTFQQGIGLGLTVSRKLARKLGGDLVLDPDYSEGARFVLTIPKN